MMAWTEIQFSYIADHLGVDMTASELARVFMVAPQEIHRAFYECHRHRAAGKTPSALHTPGGGSMLSGKGVRGATAMDVYTPMDFWDFQEKFRPRGWRPPL